MVRKNYRLGLPNRLTFARCVMMTELVLLALLLC